MAAAGVAHQLPTKLGPSVRIRHPSRAPGAVHPAPHQTASPAISARLRSRATVRKRYGLRTSAPQYGQRVCRDAIG